MHFSRSCIVARICVTFNYPTIVLALPMQLFNNKQPALFLLYFVPFLFSFRRPFCLVFAYSDREYLTYFGCVVFFLYLGD